MSGLEINFGALLTVTVVSFLGANALVVAFGMVLVGLGRFDEARSENKSGAPYAVLAVVAALVCLALLVMGFIAVIRG